MQGGETKERLVAKRAYPLALFAGGDKSGRHQAGPRFSAGRAGLKVSFDLPPRRRQSKAGYTKAARLKNSTPT